jgi:hypothetical protein
MGLSPGVDVMRILTITGLAAVALLASGFASEASAQGRGRGQNEYRARGFERARQVANERARFLRDDDCDCDRDSDRKWKKAKHRKHSGNCDRRDGVFRQRTSRLPSRVCVDANSDGICDNGTIDRRRPRTGTGGVILGRRTPGNAGVILGKRVPGSTVAQQVGLMLLQTAYAQQFR